MESFFSVQLSAHPRSAGVLKAGLSFYGFKLGRIEKVLEPGRFLVILESGPKVVADGPRSLKAGNPVRVFSNREARPEMKGQKEKPSGVLKAGGNQWGFFLPLGFGGKKASARIKVFVEGKQEGWGRKTPRAVYFVIWTQTEKLGEVQWSIYLRERQVSLHVFAKREDVDRVGMRELAASVENNLKLRGFVLVTPTVYLERPFKVPEGFRLNVRG